MNPTLVSAPKSCSGRRLSMWPLRLLSLLVVTLVSVPAVFGDAAIPPLHAHVTDTTGALDESSRAALEARLVDFEQRKGSQIAVLLVPSTRPESIEAYGIRVAEQWKIGRDGVDDGAILIIARDDHRLRIEVGYGLEGVLNDATASRIISDTITPEFKRGNFARGIDAGVGQMMAVIDGEVLPAAKVAKKHGRPGYEWEWPTTLKDIAIFIGILVIFVITVLSTSAGLSGLTGSIISALLCAGGVGFFTCALTDEIALNGLAGVLTFAGCFAMNRYLMDSTLFPVLPARHSRGQGGTSWRSDASSTEQSSISSGSSSSSSSSSDSDYSGGGGSFGGGGASGSW